MKGVQNDYLDLPKLSKLISVGGGTFYSPRYVVLESDSHLDEMILRYA